LNLKWTTLYSTLKVTYVVVSSILNTWEPIERVIHDYGGQAGESLHLFSVVLKMYKVDETPSERLAHVCSEHHDVEKLKIYLTPANISSVNIGRGASGN
jgi:hypothetical protein